MAAKKIQVEDASDEEPKRGHEGEKGAAAADAAASPEPENPKAQEGAPCDGEDSAQAATDEEAIAAEADAAVASAEADAQAQAAAEGGADELVSAKKQAAEMQDKYLRLKAEWDNFRKRTALERDEQKKRATERLVSSLLPVIDDFERAIEHAKTNPDANTLREGVEAVHAKMLGVLEKEHLVQIDALNQPFDANEHQAVSTREDKDVFDETVVQVFQNGYKMGDRVLRPAMVVVSTGGEKRPPQEETQDKTEE